MLNQPTDLRELPPNLPQHDFQEPYARLLTLGKGDFPEVYDEVADELKAGDSQAAAAQLLQMVTDETYYEYDEEDPRIWTCDHTIRVLSRLGEAAQIAIEPLLPLLNSDDDWLQEDVVDFYAEIGRPAIGALTRQLTDPTADTYARAAAGDSLEGMATKHPELRSEIIPILEQALVAEDDDPEVAGFLVCNLMDLNSQESLPLIAQAFEEERVDEMIVDMSDVEYHFKRLEDPSLPLIPLVSGWREENEEEDPEEQIAAAHGLSREENVPYVAPYKVGRNDPCPCGSGKKYKKCCGAGT